MPAETESLQINPQDLELVSVPDFAHIPGMLSLKERKFLYWLASTVYEGRGSIVEVGSWLGSSAACLAAGMKASRSQGRLHCFDRFEADANEAAKAKKRGLELKIGQDTQPLFKSFVERDFTNVVSYKMRVQDIKWNQGPIEILHLDAPKKAEDLEHVLKTFGPSLIAGGSIVVFQDFVFPKAYAIGLVAGALEKSFEFFALPDPDRPTVSFKWKEKIPEGFNFDIFSWKSDDVARSWRRAEGFIDREAKKAYFNCGLAKFFYDNGAFGPMRKVLGDNWPRLSERDLGSLHKNCRDLTHYQKAPFWRKALLAVSAKCSRRYLKRMIS